MKNNICFKYYLDLLLFFQITSQKRDEKHKNQLCFSLKDLAQNTVTSNTC